MLFANFHSFITIFFIYSKDRILNSMFYIPVLLSFQHVIKMYPNVTKVYTYISVYFHLYAVTWENILTCAPNVESNQPARSLIRVFVVIMKKFCVLDYSKCAK